ncbi:hypothetical protein [Methylobacterium gnaphalii]|uniref:hypothetical protein n=1 Tax=Methylobacterium gnaphalii TaxID=1010610 RepID=UPI001479749D|nr:hypothetical protein [Methylobacterium gnaphalii]
MGKLTGIIGIAELLAAVAICIWFSRGRPIYLAGILALLAMGTMLYGAEVMHGTAAETR